MQNSLLAHWMKATATCPDLIMRTRNCSAIMAPVQQHAKILAKAAHLWTEQLGIPAAAPKQQ
jgi:hypothetical protein